MWVDIANLTGPRGQDGQDGEQGPQGPVNVGLNPNEPIVWDQQGGITFNLVDGSQQTVNLPIASAQSAGLLGAGGAAPSVAERDVTELFPGVVSGTVYLSRTGPRVTFRMEAVGFESSGTQTAVGTLPVGYRPGPGYIYLNTAQRSSSYSPTRGFRVSKYGSVDFYEVATQHSHFALVGWETPDPFPV